MTPEGILGCAAIICYILGWKQAKKHRPFIATILFSLSVWFFFIALGLIGLKS